jgi:uncharacterized repeat protein (TIGR03843 family)
MASMGRRDAPHPLEDQALVQTLTEGAVLQCRMHPYGSNAVFDVLLEGPAGHIRAIYKPRRGEAPLWDFPDGTLYKRERAAYLLSQASGWGIVPLTVVRPDGPHGVGAVQLHVEHDPRITYFDLRGQPRHRSAFAHIAAFDVLANNADRKGGHCLLDPSGRLWGIDHGLTFHEDYKLRTVIWDFQGQPIQPEDVNALRALLPCLQPGADLAAQLEELLSGREIATLRERLEVLLEDPVYPSPGPYRSVPWPPV